MNHDDRRDFVPDETLAARESEDAVALEKTKRMLGNPELARLAAGIDPRRVPTLPKLLAADAPLPTASGASSASAASFDSTTSLASHRTGRAAPVALSGALDRNAPSRASALRMRRLMITLLAVLAVLAPVALMAVLRVDPKPSASSSGVRAASTSALDTTAPSTSVAAPGPSISAHVPVPAPAPAPTAREPDAGSVKQPAPASPRGTAPSWSRPKASTLRPGTPLPRPRATHAPVPPADPAEPTEIF